MEVKVILVGNGYFGSLYRERIMRHKDYELVGIVDTDYERLITVSGMTVGESYPTIADNVDHDAVVICTTPQHHATLSVEAMNRGKDVLCMKPGAMSLTEHDHIFKARNENKVAWMIDYTQLAAPELYFIDSMILALGTAHNISLSRHVVTPPKPEGVILDLLPHDVATMFTIFHEEDINISCNVDGTKVISRICDNNGDQIAFLSASYNATYPQKYALLRILPDDEIANPRIELAWEQNQKFVEVRSQGRSVEVRFRHEPDMITRSLDSFVIHCEYKIDNYGLSHDVMRVLHAMQHSADADGAPIKYCEVGA
jgi:hypothetical protein